MYHGGRHFTCQNKADIWAKVFPDMTGAAIVIKQGVSFSLSFLLWVKLSISPNLERGLPLCPLFSFSDKRSKPRHYQSKHPPARRARILVRLASVALN